MSESDDGERIAKLEVASKNITEKLNDYILIHRDVHTQDKERMDKISTTNEKILATLDNRKNFYMLLATLIAALFAGISPIAVALINSGTKP
jgi:hypothetical protein